MVKLDPLVHIEDTRASADIRAELALEPAVLLAFSTGKDALASWLALVDSGCETIYPYYLYYVPGLAFVEESLDRFEQHFGQRIARYPHPSIYRMLNNLVFQPPERLAIIEAARLPSPSYETMVDLIREDLGLPADTWVADGVRAADSIVRRTSIKVYGPMKVKSRKVSVIWDWRKAPVLARVAAAGLKLPPDYEWFGRSFDGIDHRFLEPLSRFAPADYRRVLDWFPLADLEMVRRRLGA